MPTVDSPQKGLVMRKAFQCHDIIIANFILNGTIVDGMWRSILTWVNFDLVSHNQFIRIISWQTHTQANEHIIMGILSMLTHLPPTPYMRLWTKSALVQVMACRLFCVKPLAEIILTCYQLNPREQTSVKIESRYQILHSWKCIWKCRLRNGGHFLQGKISYYYSDVIIGYQTTGVSTVTQLFVQAQIKENINAPRQWPLWGEFTGDRWILLTKDQ